MGLGLAGLSGSARARFATAARLVEVADGAAVVALPNEPHRQRCEEVRADLEAALSAAVGSAVPVRLVVDEGGPGGSSASPNSARPRPTTRRSTSTPSSTPRPLSVKRGADRLVEAFPGAELIEDDQ